MERGQAPRLGRRGEKPDAIAPDGSEIRLVIDARHAATHSSLVEVTLAAGQVSRPVRHRTVEEVWYVLEGCGRVWRQPPSAGAAAMPPLSVSPGDALTIPAGWGFQFAAGPDGRLRVLCHTVPPWPGAEVAVSVEAGGLGDATV